MTMTTFFPDKLDRLWQQANQQWQALMHHLQLAQHYAQQLLEHSPQQNPFHRLQTPMLQLRLDNQDVIRALLAFHRSFCNALGIDSQHSALDNLAQVKYLLGDESTDQDLSLLSRLLSDLEKVYDISHKNYLQQLEQQRLQKQTLQKILQRLRQDSLSGAALTDLLDLMNDVEYAAYLARTERYDATHSTNFIERYSFNLAHELATALELQTLFEYSLEQLTEAMQVYEGDFKLSASEYDHLAGLRGPIDKFYTAIVNGIIVLRDLFVLFFGHKTLQAQQAKTMLANQATQLKQQIQQLMNLQQHNIQHQQQYQHMLNQQFANLRQQQLMQLPPAATLPNVMPQMVEAPVKPPPVTEAEPVDQQQQSSLNAPLKNPSATDLNYTSALRRWFTPL